MPIAGRATLPQSTAGKGALEGAAIAMQGAVRGQEKAEDSRRFNEQMTENQRQFGEEMKYKVQSLRAMVQEGKLSREMEERLKRFEESETFKRLKTNIDADTVARNETFTFTGGENVKNRNLEREITAANNAESNLENKRIVSERYTASRRQLELGQQQLDLERGSRVYRESLESQQRLLSQFGGDWDSMNEQQRQALAFSYARDRVGNERWDGTIENPATDAERTAAIQNAYRDLAGFKVNSQQYVQRVADNAYNETLAQHRAMLTAESEHGYPSFQTDSSGGLGLGRMSSKTRTADVSKLLKPPMPNQGLNGAKGLLGFPDWDIDYIAGKQEDGGIGSIALATTLSDMDDLLWFGVLEDIRANKAGYPLAAGALENKEYYWQGEVDRFANERLGWVDATTRDFIVHQQKQLVHALFEQQRGEGTEILFPSTNPEDMTFEAAAAADLQRKGK